MPIFDLSRKGTSSGPNTSSRPARAPSPSPSPLSASTTASAASQSPRLTRSSSAASATASAAAAAAAAAIAADAGTSASASVGATTFVIVAIERAACWHIQPKLNRKDLLVDGSLQVVRVTLPGKDADSEPIYDVAFLVAGDGKVSHPLLANSSPVLLPIEGAYDFPLPGNEFLRVKPASTTPRRITTAFQDCLSLYTRFENRRKAIRGSFVLVDDEGSVLALVGGKGVRAGHLDRPAGSSPDDLFSSAAGGKMPVIMELEGDTTLLEFDDVDEFGSSASSVVSEDFLHGEIDDAVMDPPAAMPVPAIVIDEAVGSVVASAAAIKSVPASPHTQAALPVSSAAPAAPQAPVTEAVTVTPQAQQAAIQTTPFVHEHATVKDALIPQEQVVPTIVAISQDRIEKDSATETTVMANVQAKMDKELDSKSEVLVGDQTVAPEAADATWASYGMPSMMNMAAGVGAAAVGITAAATAVTLAVAAAPVVATAAAVAGTVAAGAAAAGTAVAGATVAAGSVVAGATAVTAGAAVVGTGAASALAAGATALGLTAAAAGAAVASRSRTNLDQDLTDNNQGEQDGSDEQTAVNKDDLVDARTDDNSGYPMLKPLTIAERLAIEERSIASWATEDEEDEESLARSSRRAKHRSYRVSLLAPPVIDLPPSPDSDKTHELPLTGSDDTAGVAQESGMAQADLESALAATRPSARLPASPKARRANRSSVIHFGTPLALPGDNADTAATPSSADQPGTLWSSFSETVSSMSSPAEQIEDDDEAALQRAIAESLKDQSATEQATVLGTAAGYLNFAARLGTDLFWSPIYILQGVISRVTGALQAIIPFLVDIIESRARYYGYEEQLNAKRRVSLMFIDENGVSHPAFVQRRATPIIPSSSSRRSSRRRGLYVANP
ncbi:hypothetical protein BC831DRAFT_550494 [Entophlyctis helioformis]|nr:hypothetical protein BC831DRAFT_550494 [Entophlyctis helioformis]